VVAADIIHVSVARITSERRYRDMAEKNRHQYEYGMGSTGDSEIRTNMGYGRALRENINAGT